MKTRRRTNLHDIIKQRSVIAPIAIGANGTKAGNVIDRLEYGGVEFIASFGNVTTTGTECTLVIMEGHVTGVMTSAADIDLLGTEYLAGLRAATPRTSGVSKNVAKRVGYRGPLRYLRADLITAGATSAACVAVTAIMFNPALGPTSNP